MAGIWLGVGELTMMERRCTKEYQLEGWGLCAPCQQSQWGADLGQLQAPLLEVCTTGRASLPFSQRMFLLSPARRTTCVVAVAVGVEGGGGRRAAQQQVTAVLIHFRGISAVGHLRTNGCGRAGVCTAERDTGGAPDTAPYSYLVTDHS